MINSLISNLAIWFYIPCCSVWSSISLIVDTETFLVGILPLLATIVSEEEQKELHALNTKKLITNSKKLDVYMKLIVTNKKSNIFFHATYIDGPV